MAFPHQQMIKHIAHLLNVEEEVHHYFPTNHSLLPIDMSPSHHHIEIPNTLPSYPGDEFIRTTKPNYPDSPPTSSPELLPIPPPHFHDSISITPLVTSATNSTYTLPVIPAFIKDVLSHSPSLISPMAMVLYQQAETNKIELKAMDTDAEGHTPSPKGPQPGVFPSPGWKDNFTTTGTHHFVVIPDGKEDVIAPFISYDLYTTFPELLATNGHGCTVHSCPLHAHPLGQHHTPISPKDKLILSKGMQFTDLVDWALVKEDNATLQGKVQYFRSHQSKATQITCRISTLKESLQTKQLTMYCSSEHLAAANAIACICHCIDCDMQSAPYFKGKKGCKALVAIQDCAIHIWGRDNCKMCNWCRRSRHNIKDCHCLGYCHHCSHRGHNRTDCLRPHDFCNENKDCKVYPSHPNFECGYCAAIDNDIDV